MLLVFALGLVGELTSDNFTEWINKEQRIPVFVRLMSQWCPHCMEMEPVWDRVKDHYRNTPGLLVADLSCDSESKICSSFADSGTPRLFWTESGVETAYRYVNTYSFESFVEFIEKRMSDPVQTLWNHEEYERTQKLHWNESLVFVQDPSSDVESLLNILAKEFEKAPIRFFKFGYNELESQDLKMIYRFMPLDILEEYDIGNYQESNVRRWVEERSYPPISEANSFFVSRMVKNKYFMIFYQSPDDFDFVENMTRITGKVPRWLKTGLIDCDQLARVCRMFGINKYRGSHLVIVNAPRNRYFRFNDEFNDTAVERWINNALHGRVQALGPGAGWQGFFFNLGLQVKTWYFWKWTIISIISLIILIMIVVKVWRAVERWVNEEEMQKNEEMMKEMDKRLEELAERDIEDIIREDELEQKKLRKCKQE